MILTRYFSRVRAAAEQDPDELADDIYRFIPERDWTPEQRKIVDDWLQRRNEERLADQRRQQEEDLSPVTLDSEVRALWGSGKGLGSRRMDWDTAYVIGRLEVRTVGQLIKTTYEKIKKAAWDQVAESFGYTESFYNPLPPAGWEEMSNTEKRVAIHNRSLSTTRSVVYDFHGCLKREYRHPYDYTIHQLAPLPQPAINWINYLWDEEQNDDEMKQKDARDEAALKEQDERWAQEAKKMEADAQLIGAALWKARKRLPYWEDATKEDAVEMARRFLTAEPYERGQFSAAIRDIIAKTLKRRIPTKSYYMEPDEAGQFVQTALTRNLKSANLEQVVEVFNKAVGITNNPDPYHPVWSEEGVHPGLGGNTLGQAGMLKTEAAAEIQKRLKEADESGDDATIRKIYYALDAENRRFFFREKSA